MFGIIDIEVYVPGTCIYINMAAYMLTWIHGA
jgi:hypothetical protein